MKYLINILLCAITLFGVSCIENDVPYPSVELNISGIKGEGFAVSDIDAGTRTVTLRLDEQTDIRNVRIDQVTFSLEAQNTTLSDDELLAQMRPSRELVGTFDMRTPIYVTLTLYEDSHWAIRAEQQIPRSFTVAGQVGATTFDIENRTATAYVAKDADLTQVEVTSLKLGPMNITAYSPTREELSGTNFESVRFVDVKAHGVTERWMLYVLKVDKSVELRQVDPWSCMIWLYGSGIEGSERMGFRYKLATEPDDAWKEVPNVQIDGGSFSACLAATPDTQYDIVAYCNDEETYFDPKKNRYLTQGVSELVNGGFELWSIIDKIVYPFLEEKDRYWGTGNKGAAVANATLTDKAAPRPGSSGTYSANLQSKFANIAGIGKFAAGNLFTGDYLRNEGTNGVITFGRKFSLRPTAMRIWMKYTRGIIDKVKGMPIGTEIKVGDPDNGHIYIALGTWTKEEYGKNSLGVVDGTDDSPICIDTRDAKTFFKSNSKDVVALGEVILTQSVDEWQEVVIEIKYRDTHTVPTHLMIVCSASRYGDYFTGSTKSEMWVDDFELLYDYSWKK